ncbi:MAG: DUF2298 domain-containing protein [Vampirovibrionia bacterium]
MIISNSIQWFISIEMLAIISFILTFKFFNHLNDKGYCISKITGIALSGLISWILMLIGNGNYLFSKNVTYISIGILLLSSILIFFKLSTKEDKKDFLTFIDKRYKFILTIEAIFIGILIAGTYIKGFSPDILGIEKLQEYVYIKSILLSKSVPAINLWFSGHTLNNFYFGYFSLANIINLSSIDIDLAFNLIPATILALIIIGSGGIIYNITNSKTYGIIGALITGFITNYEAMYQIFKGGIINGFNWWLTAHSFSNGIFTEFPYWSFILGDIPSEVINNVFIIGLLYFIYADITKENNNDKNIFNLNELILTILISILSAIIILTNENSLPILLLLLTTTYIFPYRGSKETAFKIINYLTKLITVIITTSIILIPFLLSHKWTSITTSFNYNWTTEINTTFLYSFGWLLIAPLIYGIIIIKEKLNLKKQDILFIVISLICCIELYISLLNAPIFNIITIIINILIITVFGYFIHRYLQNTKKDNKIATNEILKLLVFIILIMIAIFKLPLIATSILIIFLSIYLMIKEENIKDYITSCLLFTGILTLLAGIIINMNINEIGINIPNSEMIANSILILSIAAILIIFKSINTINIKYKDIYIISLILILAPCFIFTPLSTMERTHNFKAMENLVPNLSGSNHLKIFHTTDFQSVEWLKNNVKNDEVILEKCTDNDTFSGRISSYAGVSNIINWPGKQITNYSIQTRDEITNRVKDVDKIYSEINKTKIKDLIKKYKIKYIYVGELERKSYSRESLNSFNQIAKEVYKTSDDPNNSSIIYEVF